MIFHRSGLISGVYLFVVTVYGAFLQIVNKKGRFQRAYLQKCTKHVRTRGMITCDGKSDHRSLLLVPLLAWRDWDAAGSEKQGKTI